MKEKKAERESRERTKERNVSGNGANTESSYIASEKVKQCSYLNNSSAVSPYLKLPHDTTILTQEKENIYLHKNV